MNPGDDDGPFRAAYGVVEGATVLVGTAKRATRLTPA